jgi:hypothetical protein
MRTSVLAFVTVLCSAFPALAVDVIFNGTVADTCGLAVPIPATGTMRLGGDPPTILGSDQSGGVPVSLTITSTGTNTITVGAPTLTSQPVGYSTSGQSLQIGYVGTGGLSIVNRPIAAGSSSFPAGILGITVSTILINARIVNANGFAQGDYQLTSVITCS